MRTMRALVSRVIGLFRSDRSDRDFAAEIDSHLQLHVDDNIRAGMSPDEARRVALVKLGSPAAVTQAYRERRGLPRLESLWQDIRYAMRGLRRNPGFAAACIATLALGIGVNSAIFGVVNGVLLTPLPYERPDRLVSIWTRHPEVQRDLSATSVANALDLRRMLTTVSGLEVLQANVIPTSVVVNAEPVPAQAVLMMPGMFALLGRDAMIGRALREGDASGTIVLSHAFWLRHFGADPSVVGREINEGRRLLTVVGIMPREFTFPYASMLRASVSFTSSADVDFWAALAPGAPNAASNTPEVTRTTQLFAVVARLEDGVTLTEAQADLAVAWRQLAQSYPDANAGWEALAVPLHDQTVAPVRSALLLLLAGVGVVLLIACVNVANLLLARGVARQRELAMRVALGAGRLRLVQQVLIESLTLSLLGAGAGLLFARWATPALVAWAPPSTPRIQEVTTDWSVAMFAVAAAVTCGLAVGLLPGLGASRASARAAIAEGSRGSSDGRRRLRGTLVAAEVGLAMVLTVGAGLLVRSFLSVVSVDAGFRSDNLMTMSVNVPGSYNTEEKRLDFYRRLFPRLEQVPGIMSVGGVTRLPLGGANSSTQVAVEGRIPPDGQWPQADFRRALHDYFNTMGIPLRRGRAFDERDRAGAPPVVVINETFARQMFGDEDPIGQQIRLGPSSPVRQATIIGIVGDLRHQRLDAPPVAEIYIHYLQGPPVAPLLVIRAAGDAAALAPAVRAAMREVDRGVMPSNVRTMEDLRSASTLDRRFLMSLVVGFGLLALVLAAVGVYGVMTLVVAERRREMGIRLALGAAPAALMALVVRYALTLGLAGGVTGIVAALMLSPLIASQLYGVGAVDPLTIGGVFATLMVVALVASLIPARRVLRVDPAITLRCD